jgi:hypothetical protein
MALCFATIISNKNGRLDSVFDSGPGIFVALRFEELPQI